MATNPKWPLAKAISRGRSALNLAIEERPVIEPRLAAGLLDGLCVDLDDVEGRKSDATLATEKLRQATRTQNIAAASAYEFLSAARAAIARSRAPSDALTAFGMQLRPRETKVDSIVTALQALLDGAAQFPELARAAGLLHSDLDSARALKQSLSAADTKQENLKDTRKRPVRERKAVQVRIEKAVDAIVNAGTLAFVHQPEIADRFRALVPSKPSRKASTSASKSG